jgi:hypothetical protein
MLEIDPARMNRKRLEQIWGFLQYITQTYTSLTSYLIGFHMTIDSWHEGQDSEGWQLPIMAWRNLDKPNKDWGGMDKIAPAEAPAVVAAVPRFKNDVGALLQLMEPEQPPLKHV